jgi:hypothetical protein
MKTEYQEGPKARDDFEKGMTALFRVPKAALKEKPKPERKQSKTGKD